MPHLKPLQARPLTLQGLWLAVASGSEQVKQGLRPLLPEFPHPVPVPAGTWGQVKVRVQGQPCGRGVGASRQVPWWGQGRGPQQGVLAFLLPWEVQVAVVWDQQAYGRGGVSPWFLGQRRKK